MNEKKMIFIAFVVVVLGHRMIECLRLIAETAR